MHAITTLDGLPELLAQNPLPKAAVPCAPAPDRSRAPNPDGRAACNPFRIRRKPARLRRRVSAAANYRWRD